MTTTDAAAAWHVQRCIALTALISLLGVGLGGCGGTNSFDLFGSSNSVAPDAAQATQTAQANQTKIAIAPVIGAPDAVSKQLSAQLTSAVEKQRITVVQNPADKADYTLRGYMVAAKERKGVKLSYIWDLTDGSGKRVNRIQREEIVPGGDNRDPWSAVSPPVIQTISDKTAELLNSALASLAPTAAGAASPSGIGATAGAAPAAGPTQTASAGPARSASTTGSISKNGEGGAVVSTVSGAPGDGNASLASAMKVELQNLKLAAPSAGGSAYVVAGKVALAAPKNGKQNIKIDWQVCDPANKFVATVHQSNDINAGALDGSWGQTAKFAAQAAAVKINDVIAQDRKGLSAAKQKSCGGTQGAGSAAARQAKSTN